MREVTYHFVDLKAIISARPLFERLSFEEYGYQDFQLESDNGPFIVRFYNYYTLILLTQNTEAFYYAEQKYPLGRGRKMREKAMVNGLEYQASYVNSFLKGIKQFNDDYPTPANYLYGPQADNFLKDLHSLYYEHDHFASYAAPGYSFVKVLHPRSINNDIVRHFGYASGIIFMIEQLIEKYPSMFENFHLCQLDSKTLPLSKNTLLLETTTKGIRTASEEEEIIGKYLNPLRGYWRGDKYKKILSVGQFTTLKESVLQMVQSDKLPDSIIQIASTQAPIGFITHTFYQLHKALYGRNKKKYWLDFLLKTFGQLRNTEWETLNKNFSTYRNSYQSDVDDITYDL